MDDVITMPVNNFNPFDDTRERQRFGNFPKRTEIRNSTIKIFRQNYVLIYIIIINIFGEKLNYW